MTKLQPINSKNPKYRLKPLWGKRGKIYQLQYWCTTINKYFPEANVESKEEADKIIEHLESDCIYYRKDES